MKSLGEVDWTIRSTYIVEKHGITSAQANEALGDPNRVLIEPDYNSQSGESARAIGYSSDLQAVITVIVLERENVVHGVNAWRSNARDQSIYRKGHL